MQRIAVAMEKGGVGKTFVAVTVAHFLASQGKRVLLCDTDPQGSTTYWVLPGDEPPARGMMDFLTAPVGSPPPVVAVEFGSVVLDLLPATEALEAVGEWLAVRPSLSRHKIIAERLAALPEPYDAVVLDTAPGFTGLNTAVLFAADQVLAPVQLDPLALEALARFMGNLDLIARETDHRPGLRVVPNMYDSREIKCRQALAILSKNFVGRITRPLPKSVRVAEAPGHHRPITDHAPAMRDLVAEMAITAINMEEVA